MTTPAVEQNPFAEYLARYENDVVGWIRTELGLDPEPYQIEVLEAYQAGERRISIRSGHGVGKTAVLSWIICHALVFKYPCKIVCTAPTSKQLFDALAAEVKTWLKRLPPAILSLFEIKTDRIELISAREEVFVSFTTSSVERPEALAGVHSDRGWVLLICDEASGIPDAIFEAGSGSMSGHNAMTILAGNPVRTSGLFFDTHNKAAVREFWRTIHISCVNSKRVARDFIEDMARRYGEASNAFRVRVLGEFPLADEDTVFPYYLVDAAMRRDVKPLKVRPIWGLDVGKKDRAVLCKRKGNCLTEKLKTWTGLDTMQLVGRIKTEWDVTSLDERPSEINVDAIGIGAGVADRLRELGLPARSINVSESASLEERYVNLRAELFFKGRAWFEAKDCNIAEDQDLMDELVKPTFETKESNGKVQIESKKSIKKRNEGRSIDLADAFLLTFASEAVSATIGSTEQVSWRAPLKRNIPGIV